MNRTHGINNAVLLSIRINRTHGINNAVLLWCCLVASFQEHETKLDSVLYVICA